MLTQMITFELRSCARGATKEESGEGGEEGRKGAVHLKLDDTILLVFEGFHVVPEEFIVVH